MYRIKEWFSRFMAGRYGQDSLQKFICVLIILTAVLSLVFEKGLLSLINSVLFVIFIFRMLSRNFLARQKENQAFLKYFTKFSCCFKVLKMQFGDKSHRYRVCPNCKAVMRLPYKKGKHTVTCRNCKKDFKVNIMF